jgi:hypothetical protein
MEHHLLSSVACLHNKNVSSYAKKKRGCTKSYLSFLPSVSLCEKLQCINVLQFKYTEFLHISEV